MPQAPSAITRPSRSERSGPGWSRWTTGGSRPARLRGRPRGAGTPPPAPSSRRSAAALGLPSATSSSAAIRASPRFARPTGPERRSRSRSDRSLRGHAVSTPPSRSSNPVTSIPSRTSAPAARARAARWRTVCIASAQPPACSCRECPPPPANRGRSRSGTRGSALRRSAAPTVSRFRAGRGSRPDPRPVAPGRPPVADLAESVGGRLGLEQFLDRARITSVIAGER